MQSAEYLEREPSLSCRSLSDELMDFDAIRLTSVQPRGSVLFTEGQPCTGVYVLCAGRMKVSVSSSDGKVLIVRIARAGELLGLSAVLKGRPYEATVETLEPCRVGFISRSDFLNHLDQSKTAYSRVLGVLANELSEVTEQARLVLLSASAQERLARLLLKWVSELGETTANGTHLNHGLTQEEIGQLICVSRETVSRLFTELKRKQILRLDGSGILVNSRAALESLAS